MRLGIGAKAGLASGIIIVTIYISTILIIALLIIGSKILPSLSLLEVVAVIPLWFIEGYYGSLIQQSRILPIIKPELWAYGFDLIFTPIFSILLLLISILFGRIFQALYTIIPSQSNTKKGLVYGFFVWLVMGIAGLIYTIFIRFDTDIFGHIYTIVTWLLYGFLLGRFYDAFSREPDAGIFYVIKKVVFRR